ncbi:MAG: prepilin-type N-terminal cleavage/methylation domain-containing protein [Actinobacteria bacterium]|nr:prepilin-type N-terminal cleavage/methylation domain-containing protein [Actinomycetota bacterium]
MKWFYRRLYKKEKGFTLVELMVVIIILAVLTGIAIPSYMALRDRARIQATRSEMQNIGTALSIYEADREAYPPVATWNTDLETGNYMNPVPVDDAWGAAYVYALTATGYTVTSTAGGGVAIVLTDGQLN